MSSTGSTRRLAVSDNKYAILPPVIIVNPNYYIAGVILHGAPRQHESQRCSIGIILCLIFYAANKCLVYLCLIERVRAVWSTTRQRWRSPVYLFCVLLLLPLFGTIAGLLIPQAIRYVYNGYCVLGINRPSSIFLLSYDIFTNLFLTGMFVIPLVRATIRSAWLRTVAIRSTVASLIALVTTSVNGVVVYVLDGNETIWICFGGWLSGLLSYIGLYKDPERPPTHRPIEYTFRPSETFPPFNQGPSIALQRARVVQ
ncbi:unnamed protein product [Rhizoctonia solani]|uniref:Transmembrane protein n=1 Tax=Rhizoctonia solani TaxID=456999 RepID=A0A8H3E847_9AGAM|nr:unnamed protein product [Rhizoctonia solani]